jgi:molecular chaperone DnaJ
VAVPTQLSEAANAALEKYRDATADHDVRAELLAAAKGES